MAVCLALAASPIAMPAALRAQDRQAPPRLEDLIPDYAVENPMEWATDGTDADVPVPEEEPFDLEPGTPMEEMPLLTLDDPAELDLPEIEPIEPVEEIEFATFDDVIPPIPEGSEEQISDELVLVFPADTSLFPVRDEFLERFRSLSAVEDMEDDDSLARLAAQARADEELLQRMLRTYGYFDGQVIRTVGNVDETAEAELDRPAARFEVLPGQRYTVGDVDLGNLMATGELYPALRNSYEVFPGDPVSLDAIENERFDLDEALGESGYPFAAIEDPSLLVDHARQEGDVTMPVMPGGRYAFGRVRSNLPDFLSGEHLSEIARFEPGDIYQRSDEMDLRRAILATGLVGSVALTPVVVEPPSAGDPGTVDIAVEMTEAPLRTLAGSIGYGTEEGFRLEGSWEHRNLFPPEGMLRVRGIAGTQEQLLGVTFRKNNFHGRDRILTIDAFASTIDYAAYDSRTISLIGIYERVSTLLFQKPFSWSIGAELVATREREADAEGNLGPFNTYFVGAIPGYAQIDQTDDLLDPTQGFRLSGRVSPEVSSTNGVQSFYFRNQADASYYRGVSENVVLAGRIRLASIPGAPISAIAPSRRIYAGGGGSVRGYGYREIGPQSAIGDPTGGRSATEVSVEARIRTGLLDGALGVVPFIDAGTVGTDPIPGFDNIQIGAGVGVRYHTGFGPIRLDVAVPLNPGPDDAPVAVYVALGQAF